MQDRFAHLPQVWRECIAAFLVQSEQKSGSTKTKEVYTSVLSMFFDRIADPAAVSRADVRDYLSWPSRGNRNRGQPISISRRNQRLTTLSAFYKFSSAWEDESGQVLYQKSLPTAGLQVLQDVRRNRSMSDEEIARFFAAITEADDGSPRSAIIAARSRALFTFYLLSGRRRAELQRLLFKDVFQATVTDGRNGRRQAWCYAFTGKGKSRIADKAELPQVVYDLLVEYLHIDGRLNHMKPDDPLFASAYPGARVKPLSGGWLNREFQRYAALAGLDKARTIHSFRHSFAAIRYSQGDDPFSICTALRHSSLDMTMKYLSSLVSTGDRGSDLIIQRLPFLAVQR